MEAVRVLAEEIGPRAACSDEERRAARWCADRLADDGLEVEMESFAARPNLHAWFAFYLGVSAAGAVLTPLVPFVGFVAGIAALLLYAREVEARPLVEPRGGESVNVLARRRAAGAATLVVVAALDSPRLALTAGPRWPPGRRGWTLVVSAALVLVPATSAAAWVAQVGHPLPAGLWGFAAALAAILGAGAALEAHSHRSDAIVPGANDSASAVEVVLRMARRFDDAGVWWLLAGARHAGNRGIADFIARHRDEIGEARFLNIEAVGRGTVGVAHDEGSLRVRRADPALVDAALEAGAEGGEYRSIQSAAAVLIGHHHRAATLVGLDEHGRVPDQSWVTDVVDRVDPATIDRAEQVAARVVAVVTGARDTGAAPSEPRDEGRRP